MFLDLLKQELGESRDAADQLRFHCPFCGEHKHKFYVKKDNGLWICFKCSEKGNPVSFVMEYYGIPFPEAVDILATYDYDVENERDNKFSPTQYGSDLTEEEQLFLFISREGQPFDQAVNSLYKCPAPPTNIKALSGNFNNPEAFPFFQYLHGRGVSLEDITKHNISYVTNGQVQLRDGRKMDLYNHLVFYTFDDKRKPIYWNTRSIDPNPFIKSFNAPGGETEYSKNNTIFNLNNAKKTDRIVINEGVFDALTVGMSGVATFGKKITEKQMDLLVEAAEPNNLPIYIFLDDDASKEMVQAVQKLQDRLNSPLYLVVNKTGMDANDLGPERSKELVDNAILADTEGQLLFDILNL
jgi:DNA primase